MKFKSNRLSTASADTFISPDDKLNVNMRRFAIVSTPIALLGCFTVWVMNDKVVRRFTENYFPEYSEFYNNPS